MLMWAGGAQGHLAEGVFLLQTLRRLQRRGRAAGVRCRGGRWVDLPESSVLVFSL